MSEVRDFIFNLFKTKLPKVVVYHNFSHTSHVVNTVTDICLSESVDSDDQEILELAAWFHDTGYTRGFERHEEESVKIAKEFLQKHNYPSFQDQ